MNTNNNVKDYFERYYTKVPFTPKDNCINKIEHYFNHTPPYMIVQDVFKWVTLLIAIGVPVCMIIWLLFINSPIKTQLSLL